MLLQYLLPGPGGARGAPGGATRAAAEAGAAVGARRSHQVGRRVEAKGVREREGCRVYPLSAEPAVLRSGGRRGAGAGGAGAGLAVAPWVGVVRQSPLTFVLFF